MGASDALRAPVDFPVVAATVLVGAVLIVVANLVVDIALQLHRPEGEAVMTSDAS